MKKGTKISIPRTDEHKKKIGESVKMKWTEERKKEQSLLMKRMRRTPPLEYYTNRLLYNCIKDRDPNLSHNDILNVIKEIIENPSNETGLFNV